MNAIYNLPITNQGYTLTLKCPDGNEIDSISISKMDVETLISDFSKYRGNKRTSVVNGISVSFVKSEDRSGLDKIAGLDSCYAQIPIEHYEDLKKYAAKIGKPVGDIVSEHFQTLFKNLRALL